MTAIKLVKKIINAQTGEIVEREFTQEEYEQQKIDKENLELRLLG